jgi:nucleotide-binding universal stress UspA family protein
LNTRESGPAIIVGIDGSKAALHAALWAIEEAAARDAPLRLVYVIDALQATDAGALEARRVAARSALHDAFRAVDATSKRVEAETEILWGRPLAKLMQESRSAIMICVGSMGLNHARCGEGSVAGALAGSSLCPVAVIHRSPDGTADANRTPRVHRVVAEVDNGTVLRHAFEEARLRKVPLHAISAQGAGTSVGAAEGNHLAQAQLDRRLNRWARLYPDVSVEPAIVRGHACRYMADNAAPGQLFVTDAYAAQVCSVYKAGSSVLTVRCRNL